MIVRVGLGLVSILGAINGIRSVLVYMVLWPIMLVYLRWAMKILPAFKINEGVKKGMVLVFLICSVVFG